MSVTAVMIAYENEDASVERLQRDLLPALHDPRVDEYELIVIDNSAEESALLRYVVTGNPYDHGQYCWQGGANLMYGPSINLAVNLASHPYLLYVCTSHGHAHDPTWALDLLEPVIAGAAMSGSLRNSGPDGPDDLPHHHIQGGVFAARTEVLRAHPYRDGEYAQFGSDIDISYRLMAAGLDLVDVPTISSSWWRRDEKPAKYVHNSGKE